MILSKKVLIMKKIFYLVALVAISLLFVLFFYFKQYGGDNNKKKGIGVEVGFAYVDLGLSVKWATCNVGANSPEDYGDYFAWGETKPKDYYDWSTYKYCDSSSLTLTKYCSKSYYGKDSFSDNKTILDSEDDAATVNWGGAWRMPTKEEQDELRNNCTWTWTILNGVNGYLVISNVEGYTDCSIFLPASGYWVEGVPYGAGLDGYYWSSSLYLIPYYAYSMGFYSDEDRDAFRSDGRSIRPVCP